jgi:hypothetical protein
MWEEFENALAWYAAAPARWVNSAKKDMSAAAEWVWIVIQGDFAEAQTVAQTVTGTVISMIPFVDQLCDVRDVVANSKKINEDSSNKWHWLALLLTLIGLFPTLGSLAKGCFKILFAYGRKGIFGLGKVALDAGVWKATKPYVEAGINKLNDFLARPEVRKTLATLKIDNPYNYLAKQLRELSGGLRVGRLTQAFDSATNALNKLLNLVKKWGSAAMQTKAGELLHSVKRVRDQANEKLAEVLKPAQDWLNQLAKRLDLEAQAKYRATTNVPNVHASDRLSLDAELEIFQKKPPKWLDIAKEGKYKPMAEAPEAPAKHFDISEDAGRPLRDAYKTFHDAKPDTLPPGTMLYRVLDPKSCDNSICWMTQVEFDKLKSKSDWRRRFAVWLNWNANGEYVTYKVPPGDGLPVWRGPTASQVMTDKSGAMISSDKKGNGFWLEGGAEQIVVNPADLRKEFASKRQHTPWPAEEADIDVRLVGVPELQSNWR